MSNLYNIVIGIEGKTLNDFEKELFATKTPYGVVLFGRNIESKEQIKNLTTSIKNIDNRINIFIDQEGGRVVRIRENIFSRKLPSAKFFSEIYYQNKQHGLELIFNNAYLNAYELINEFGINGVFAPVCDLYFDYTHHVIGDRSLGNNPSDVTEMATSWYKGLVTAGAIPCIKHIPGHGRATSDSHLELPVVDTNLAELEDTDFKVFKNMNFAGMAMTAHVVYNALDESSPVTTSKPAIDYIRNSLNFNSVIITDDLSMKALKGSIAENAKRSLDAGCDLLLHCNGIKQEMLEAYEYASVITGSTADKIQHISNEIENTRKAFGFNDLLNNYNTVVGSYAKA